MNEKKIISTKRSERYIIDGKEYHSLSEIPESERKKLDAHFRLLEDKDKDGIPDIFQRNDAQTSYVESKEVRMSSNVKAEKAGDLLKSVLQDLGVGPFGTEKQGGENKTRESELLLINRHQDERRKERIRSYIVIFALIAVIAFLVLKKL